MRTTLDLDDDLIESLRARYPHATKTEAVELAIRDHLERSAIERLIALRGSLEIEDVTAWTRADREWPT